MSVTSNDRSGLNAIRERFRDDLMQRLKEAHIWLDADRKDQHIIVNPEVISDLVSFAEIGPTDVVLEIGSGPGTITRELAKRAKNVIAVEIDKAFRPLSDALTKEYSNIEIIFEDFCRVHLPPFNKIVANPPFHILGRPCCTNQFEKQK